jgi:hypothetical protein
VPEFVRQQTEAIPVRIVESRRCWAAQELCGRTAIGLGRMIVSGYSILMFSTATDLGAMLRMHLDRRPAAILGGYQVPYPCSGIVSTNGDGVIEQFVETPTEPAGKLGVFGIDDRHGGNAGCLSRRIPPTLGSVLPRLTGRMVAFPITRLPHRHRHDGELSKGAGNLARISAGLR